MSKTVVNAGIIQPKENYLEKGKKPGSATKISEGIDKYIKSMTPTVDVKVGITKIYERNGKFFREVNGKVVELSSNIQDKLRVRGITIPNIDIEK